MSLILIVFLFLGDPSKNFHKIARVNEAKSMAENEFKKGNFKAAVKTYSMLTDSFKVNDETVLLNKAHCYYKLKDNVKAKEQYTKLSTASDKAIRSIANQQLGIMAYQDKNYDLAKNYFKISLKSLPENNEARYNYELVSKLLKNNENKDDKKQNNKDDKNTPQEPSPFAKKLKEQAEALAGSFKYEDAHKLMMDGVKKDRSVLYYKDFIDRLKVVSDISKF